MLDAFRPGESILWDTIWQSTIFLGTGLGASVLYTRRPARAHRLLVLAMLAALAAPILAQGPRLGGWGLFGQSAESPPTRIAAVSKTPSATVDLPLITGESLPLPVAHGFDKCCNGQRDSACSTARGRYCGCHVSFRSVSRVACTGAGRLAANIGCGCHAVGHVPIPGSEPGAPGSTTGRPGADCCCGGSWGRAGCKSGARAADLSGSTLPIDLVLGSPTCDRLARRCRSGDFHRLGRRVLPRAGTLAARGPLVLPARRGIGMCPALAPTGMVGQAPNGSAQRAGV